MSTEGSSNKNNDFDTTTLTEEAFGTFWDRNGKPHEITKFIWRNRNKIEVQVINYGARIVSMKFPDRKGTVEDIVLGFDDLAGYLFYQSYYIGATIGRTSHIVPNGSINVDKREYKLTKNDGNHHLNGGRIGFDQVVWAPHVSGKKVVMTHLSQDLAEGYPGDVLVRVTFELSDMNEFRINMEAFSSLPTVINLSNLTYFNLAGHNKGAEETYKQVVMINADCYLKQEKGLPTGDVCNVANFPFDFQIPKVLGKLMGICPGDGFNEYLCVNKGVDQDLAFVGRVIHSDSGRVLEMYSNQRCVRFTTTNEFGSGRFLTLEQLSQNTTEVKAPSKSSKIVQSSESEEYLQYISAAHSRLAKQLQEDKENNYGDLRNLIMKMGKSKKSVVPSNTPLSQAELVKSTETSIMGLVLTNRQREYLRGLYDTLCNEDDEYCLRLKKTIEKLLSFSISVNVKGSKSSIVSNPESPDEKPVILLKTDLPRSKSKEMKKNHIPIYYRTKTQIVGKDRFVYGMHSGIAFQTQNFPCSQSFKNFPSSALFPGENYKHTIVYKFWIRAGNPSKWVKKNKQELDKMKQ